MLYDVRTICRSFGFGILITSINFTENRDSLHTSVKLSADLLSDVCTALQNSRDFKNSNIELKMFKRSMRKFDSPDISKETLRKPC